MEMEHVQDATWSSHRRAFSNAQSEHTADAAGHPGLHQMGRSARDRRRHRLRNTAYEDRCAQSDCPFEGPQTIPSSSSSHDHVVFNSASAMCPASSTAPPEPSSTPVRRVHHQVRRRQRRRHETQTVCDIRVHRAMESTSDNVHQFSKGSAVLVRSESGAADSQPGEGRIATDQQRLRATISETRGNRVPCDEHVTGRHQGLLGPRKYGHGDALSPLGRSGFSSRRQPGGDRARDDALKTTSIRSTRERRFNSFLNGVKSFAPKNVQPSWKRSESNPEAPLHAPPVPTMHPQMFVDMLQSSTVSDVARKAISYLHDPSNYRDPQCSPLRWPMSKVYARDVQQLLTSDLCETMSDAQLKNHFGYIFTVYEAHKVRRRLVHDTLSANYLCDSPPNPFFTPLHSLRDVLSKGEFACTLDLRAMYYQIPLDPKVRRFFPFTFDGQHYQFKRLPMGFRWSVTIAQFITQFLTSSLKDVHVEVYIDNILIVGSRSAVIAARQQFLDTCKRYRVSLSEDSPISHIATYRGIRFDFGNKTFCLDPSFIRKFHYRCNNHNDSWCDWRALLGSMIYGLCALGEPFAPFFALLKWLAANVNTSPWHTVVMPAVVAQQWNTACSIILTNVPRALCSTSGFHTIITDAATETSSVAAIHITPNGRLEWFFESKPEYSSINDLEAFAFASALQRWKSHLRFSNVVWYCDNTSALAAVNATRSKSWPLNCQVHSITTTLHRLRARLFSMWIPSASNPADFPSRYHSLPPSEALDAMAFHGLTQRLLASTPGGGELAEASRVCYQYRSFAHVVQHSSSSVEIACSSCGY